MTDCRKSRMAIRRLVGKACTPRHNYGVTSAPPSRLSLYATKMSSVIDGIRQAQCLAVAVPEASVPDPGAGSGETPVAKKMVQVLGTMHVSTLAERRRQ